MTQRDNGTATVKEDEKCPVMILIRAEPTVTESILTNSSSTRWCGPNMRRFPIWEVPACEAWINSERYICYTVGNTTNSILMLMRGYIPHTGFETKYIMSALPHSALLDAKKRQSFLGRWGGGRNLRRQPLWKFWTAWNHPVTRHLACERMLQRY